MNRGDLYLVDLNPAIGCETNKKRPVLIISNNINNVNSELVTIIPITSNIEKIYPFEVFIKSGTLSGLSTGSKVQCQQIRTISKTRIIGPRLGKLTPEEVLDIESALKLHLDL